MMRTIGLLVVAALAGALGCSLDWSTIAPDGDTSADVDGDHGDTTDGDAIPPDSDADIGADADGADADADAADADADADADVTVGPPARVVGEMTATGAVPAASGCVASGTNLCMRSDSTDPGAIQLSGGTFRLRGIVVGGGSR